MEKYYKSIAPMDILCINIRKMKMKIYILCTNSYINYTFFHEFINVYIFS